eukprot:Filipodium_phascolosomae@DN2768_c0_g2_i2.p1
MTVSVSHPSLEFIHMRSSTPNQAEPVLGGNQGNQGTAPPQPVRPRAVYEFSQLQDGAAEILKLPPERQVDCLDLGGADADFLPKVLPHVFHVFPKLQEIIVVDDPNILTWANWNELLSKNLLSDPSCYATWKLGYNWALSKSRIISSSRWL